MERLNSLESAVMTKVLEGDHPVLAVLREQLVRAWVTERRMTGVGFFTDIGVPGDTAIASTGRSLRFGDVVARIPSLEHGAGFVVYVDDGRLSGLEGYTFDEAWPETVDGFSVGFVSGERSLGFLDG
jgi:hypothetical protein